jgi:hypothetical protein
MDKTGSHKGGYVLAAVLGAIGGGVLVTLGTNAIPRMMQNMMARMEERREM